MDKSFGVNCIFSPNAGTFNAERVKSSQKQLTAQK